MEPTINPTILPTVFPTEYPSDDISHIGRITMEPTINPTILPTVFPTEYPSDDGDDGNSYVVRYGIITEMTFEFDKINDNTTMDEIIDNNLENCIESEYYNISVIQNIDNITFINIISKLFVCKQEAQQLLAINIESGLETELIQILRNDTLIVSFN